ncbi:MAG: putative molybdenum carrier protein [Caldisericia bacterium]
MQEKKNLKIVSGGQTGVDRAALDAAIESAIPHGGWCPKGRLSEDGRIPDKYDLSETKSRKYPERTIMNIHDSDGTLIITRNEPTGGTLLTKNVAEKSKKPLLIIAVNKRVSQKKVEAILSWILENKINVLNVAGPRESTTPGIYEISKLLIKRVLS